MKQTAFVRISITLFLFVAMLSPTAALAAPDGKKHFKAGMVAEDAEQWDKAVEEFALAIVEDTKNPEYRLHYQRATFNASQMYMKKGAAQANEKDYVGAYDAFRRAYAYDPTNELAKSEMIRMLRLQKGLDPNGEPSEKMNEDASGVKLVPTGYQKNVAPGNFNIPQKLEKLRDLPFPNGVPLQYIIRELANELDLNVLFDDQSFRGQEGQTIKIELKQVSAAKALDYIFLQAGLFFQKVGPRTILVAKQERRINFQQLVLRTFYLANADPTEVAKVVQFAIPPQQGRVPSQPLIDKATNSITIRDTTENIRIIGNLINSLDKDRAEVVMDVQIYEVTKSDLLQLGNQIGTRDSLGNLGGTTVSTFGNNEFGITQAATSTAAATIGAAPFGIGLVIPAINLVALQDKQNTKLIASTQIHAFNNEDSSARIGKRVPVQSAQFLGYNNGTGAGTGGGLNNGGLLGNAASVFNYEQTGLTLKFTPIVFPNQDVQVKMEIESKDVTGTASLNPTFTERTIKGTARIQNNKTLLLASVAQNSQSNGRTGLPLLGLIPILGRFFTAPKKDNNQTDIVIAVTPRVIRAPAILPEDEAERPTGSVAVPTSGSLEAMIIQDDREEQLALARRSNNTAKIQTAGQKTEEPVYVRTNPAQTTETKAENKTETNGAENKIAATNQDVPPVTDSLKPIDSSVRKTLQLNQTSLTSENKAAETTAATVEDAPKTNAPTASLEFLPTLSEMKAGEKTKVAVLIKSAAAFRSAMLGLKFDSTKVAIRSVSYGEAFGAALAQTAVNPYLNQNGKMYVTLSSPKDAAGNSSGVLAYIEIEALADGKPEIVFDTDSLRITSGDGQDFAMKF